jgi:hypothetical protein
MRIPNEVIAISTRRRFWPLRKSLNLPPGKTFPIAHFDQPTWPMKVGNPETIGQADLTRIARILYSSAGVWNMATPVRDDLCFFNKPLRPDASLLFRFLQARRLVPRGSRRQIRELKPKLPAKT